LTFDDAGELISSFHPFNQGSYKAHGKYFHLAGAHDNDRHRGVADALDGISRF